ncbi:MAG: LOG family protein [Candidatus Gracilibacteria bacterium]|jgi:uncharacterized protein (TIGR00730 family)|nr:LOG family protein [Candidatus Gracilibacteria bacterium]
MPTKKVQNSKKKKTATVSMTKKSPIKTKSQSKKTASTKIAIKKPTKTTAKKTGTKSKSVNTNVKKIATKKVLKKNCEQKTTIDPSQKNGKHAILEFEKVDLTKKLDLNKFRVSIFGSARIKPDDKIYKQIFELAKHLGKEEIDLITGGGPGLMQAANDGHMAGDKNHKACSVGLTIRLPHEAKNPILEVRKHFEKFSHRLDTFMALSHLVVVTPGGIGTILELFYTLQLIQVKHINKIPIILVGKMWKTLLRWLKRQPLRMKLLDEKDLDHVIYAKNNRAAIRLIDKELKKFNAMRKSKRPLNLHIYKPDK